jgi:TIGR03009 family protein
MHATIGRSTAACALVAYFVCAAPVAAQQYAPKQARSPQPTGQRIAQAPAANGQPQRRPGATAQQLPPAQQATQGVRQPAPPAGVRRAAAQEPLRANEQPAAGAAPQAPQAPFTLTPEQQQLLDQVLVQWERQSDRVKTFKCQFGRWEVNETFGPKEFNHVLSEGQGYIKYKAPDHGIYKVTDLKEWDDQQKTYVAKTTGLDHWVCNGVAIFEFNAEKRQLIERQLAPQLQGKAIVDGPLPFIFGAKAEQLKRRYWMRDITPQSEAGRKIWLEAWPKFQQDRANFQHAIVILDQKQFVPEALRIILPDGKNKQDYKFESIQVNDPLAILKGDFLPPITPPFWQKVVEKAPTADQPASEAAPRAERVPAGALR